MKRRIFVLPSPEEIQTAVDVINPPGKERLIADMVNLRHLEYDADTFACLIYDWAKEIKGYLGTIQDYDELMLDQIIEKFVPFSLQGRVKVWVKRQIGVTPQLAENW